MSDSRQWQEVKRVFDAALACPPHDRQAYLRNSGADPAVRREVESLLVAHAGAEGFAETPAMVALALASVSDGPPASEALAPGTQFGCYHIVRQVGAGAMGEVYLAMDTRLAREVALKVLPGATAADSERMARLQHEARVLAALNHPHIATIHDLELNGGSYGLVMEFVAGPTLAQHLATRALSVARALEIARQIASALEAAHDKGIVHRDLKPANITLTVGGAVKVLDFGLAEVLSASGDDAAANARGTDGPRAPRLIAGTPAYMSPEQARGDQVDQRTDVWALGCVLFEMLSRQRPFDGDDIGARLAAIDPPAPAWHRLPDTVPEAVRQLLRKCLRPDPAHRLHHMADVRIEIEDAMRAEATRSPVQARDSGRKGVLAALAVMAAAAAGVALLSRTGPGTPPMRVVDIATPWTSDPSSFALSPDGTRLVFVGDFAGQPTLWVRPLQAAEAQPLPGTQGARQPFWSPDGKTIGFFAFTELKRIPVEGGTPQVITSIIGGAAAAWGPSGDILFSGIMSRTIVPTPVGLLRVRASGGASQVATTPAPGTSGHRSPQFLPDGRHFLFYAGGSADVRGVYVGTLDSRDAVRLAAADGQGSYVAPDWLFYVRRGALLAQRFDVQRLALSSEPIAVVDSVSVDPISGNAAVSTSSGDTFAYRSGRGATSQLAWFDRSGRPLGSPDDTQDNGWSNVALSPDGRRVVAERTAEGETALWLLEQGRRVLFTPTRGVSRSRYPVWSAKGDRIAFASIDTGAVNLVERRSAGAEEEAVLLAAPAGSILTDWSRDGRFLTYFGPRPRTGTDVWVVPTDTGLPTPFLATEANEMWAQFSPDGRWIAYQSNETGRFEISVRPFPGPGLATAISTGGGVYARWARNGSELYYVAPDSTLMAVTVRTSGSRLSAEAPVALFKTRRLGGGVNVIGYGHQYDVAPDGRFLINVESGPMRPITLVMNWTPPAR